MLGKLKKEISDFNELSVVRLLKFFSLFALIIISYAFVFCGFQVVDEFEHLHASWLVSIGKLPYRDFFEHHNPLLWYISAPVVSFFYNNVAIFYIMRAVSFIVSLATTFYLYKIVLFFEDKKCAWLAVACYLGNLITFYNFYQFRPDIYMNFCFVLGIYYLFSALKNNNTKHYMFSFLAFSFSVLFLQKIALLLFVIEAILLYLLIAKKVKFKTLLVASIPSLIVVALYFGILYKNGIILEYFALNYQFNKALVDYFQRGEFWYPNLFFSCYGLALITGLLFFKKKNIFFKIVVVVYIFEFLMRKFYFAPHPNYYTLLTILEAIVLSVWLDFLFPKRKIIAISMLVVLFLNLGNLFNVLDKKIINNDSYKHFILAKYVHENSNPDELLMNGYDMNFNIYREDVSYYWFGLDMLLPVVKQEFGISQDVDVNQLVTKYRPKFIYTRDYVDLKAYRTYGEVRYTQRFIPELIQFLYEPTPFENLVILK